MRNIEIVLVHRSGKEYVELVSENEFREIIRKHEECVNMGFPLNDDYDGDATFDTYVKTKFTCFDLTDVWKIDIPNGVDWE